MYFNISSSSLVVGKSSLPYISCKHNHSNNPPGYIYIFANPISINFKYFFSKFLSDVFFPYIIIFVSLLILFEIFSDYKISDENIETSIQTFKLTSSDGSSSDQFGHSIVISDDTAIISSRFDNDVGEDFGSVYFFR